MVDKEQVLLMCLIIVTAAGLAFDGWLEDRRETKRLEQEKEAKKALEEATEEGQA